MALEHSRMESTEPHVEAQMPAFNVSFWEVRPIYYLPTYLKYLYTHSPSRAAYSDGHELSRISVLAFTGDARNGNWGLWVTLENQDTF